MKDIDIQYFQKNLIDWYLNNHRSLPWRKTEDPYRIWVSEAMLQQTQVSTVLPYYRKFLQKFPTIKHLARAELHDVLKVWEGLGYYARARNLHRAAGNVQQQYQGVIPTTWNQFRKLPGVGDYIAAAVLSIAFGLPYAVVDGNVKRVLARLQCIAAPLNNSTSTKRFKETAEALKDTQMPGTYNQALMELGAIICKPKHPLCDRCPVQRFCLAYQTKTVAEYPKKKAARQTPQYHIAIGVVFKNGRVLITQRKPDGLLGGLWEFPGGKIKKGESAEAACVREIKEEVSLQVAVIDHLAQVKHAYTHFKITMEIFCCNYKSGRVKRNGPVAHRWIKLDEIDQYALPRANHKFLPKLKKWIEMVS
ncbi:MAG: A/G-specific adenine glycosylase [Desulfobacterales bacterium]|nr:MAG: A/G-specific adenine glycosylase [Desulfobacterales bacterium]